MKFKKYEDVSKNFDDVVISILKYSICCAYYLYAKRKKFTHMHI